MTIVRLLSIGIAALTIGFPPLIQAQSATVMTVRYGTVLDAAEVELDSDGKAVATGAAIGSVVGIGTSSRETSGRKRRSLLGGAALGALAGKVTGQIINKAWSYTVDMVDGDRVAVISKDSDIPVGSCVSIEGGADKAIIRTAPPSFCSGSSTTTATAPQSQPAASGGGDGDDPACAQAKQDLLAAQGEALDAAIQKVKVLCEN